MTRAAWLAATALVAACAPHAATTAPAPEPRDAELGDVLERFYGLVQGAHWDAAYAMCTPGVQATLSKAAFVARYDGLRDAAIHVDAPRGHRLTVTLKSGGRTLHDIVTLAWDGAQFRIDRLQRS